MRDPLKLKNVQSELASLTEVRDRPIFDPAGIEGLSAELRGVNETLWTIEDRLRECEQAGDFGAEFVELARSVYRNNDRRAAIKQQINERLRSEIVEEKSYAGCDAADVHT